MAMVFALFSYIGTEVVSVTAAESKNPQKDIPKAARQMVLRLGLFYILAIIVIVSVMPWTVAVARGGAGNRRLPQRRGRSARSRQSHPGLPPRGHHAPVIHTHTHRRR
jgi:amino acid transporter